jgi:hypothetical protein
MMLYLGIASITVGFSFDVQEGFNGTNQYLQLALTMHQFKLFYFLESWIVLFLMLLIFLFQGTMHN